MSQGTYKPRRTEAQIAREKLDNVRGRLEAKRRRRDDLTAQLDAVNNDITDLERKEAYLAANPVLVDEIKADPAPETALPSEVIDDESQAGTTTVITAESVTDAEPTVDPDYLRETAPRV